MLWVGKTALLRLNFYSYFKIRCQINSKVLQLLKICIKLIWISLARGRVTNRKWLQEYKVVENSKQYLSRKYRFKKYFHHFKINEMLHKKEKLTEKVLKCKELNNFRRRIFNIKWIKISKIFPFLKLNKNIAVVVTTAAWNTSVDRFRN